MRRYLSTFGVAALGLLAGAAWGARLWSPYWPKLSLLALGRGALVGWVIGVLLMVALRPLLGHRSPPRSHAAWLLAVLAPAGLLVTSGIRPVVHSDTRPNLILISIDALRADFLGCYGNAAGLTPALDAFAKEATQYDSAWAYSPWTLTSLGSLFTQLPPSWCGLIKPPQTDMSLYPARTVLPAELPLLSERLHGAGYATGAALVNVLLREDRGWNRGFDAFWNTKRDLETTHAEELTRVAREWMALNRREPFFLWVHYFDTHNYDAPSIPEELRARYPWQMRGRKLWEARMSREEPELKAKYQRYCRDMYTEEVKYADRWVGELLALLRASGVWDRSLIVVTADHGEELFDHGGFEHGHSLHREVLHVPLLVKWPKDIAADRRLRQTVGMPSVGATFLQFARLPACAGRVPPLLPRRASAKGAEVFSEGLIHGEAQTALTTDDWRVIYYQESGRFEVYDRRRDPLERSDLAPTGAAMELRKRLGSLTDDAQREVAARANREQGTQTAALSEEARRELKSLGYGE